MQPPSRTARPSRTRPASPRGQPRPMAQPRPTAPPSRSARRDGVGETYGVKTPPCRRRRRRRRSGRRPAQSRSTKYFDALSWTRIDGSIGSPGSRTLASCVAERSARPDLSAAVDAAAGQRLRRPLRPRRRASSAVFVGCLGFGLVLGVSSSLVIVELVGGDLVSARSTSSSAAGSSSRGRSRRSPRRASSPRPRRPPSPPPRLGPHRLGVGRCPSVRSSGRVSPLVGRSAGGRQLRPPFGRRGSGAVRPPVYRRSAGRASASPGASAPSGSPSLRHEQPASPRRPR